MALVVATLAAPISSSFNSRALLSWLGSTDFIASAVVQPHCGQLTDMYGRHTGMFVTGILFTMGNLCCGLAKEPWVLIFGRVLASVGGGGTRGMTAITSFICNGIFPLRQRGLWQGLGNLLYFAGHGLGGLLGCLLNVTWDWRSPDLVLTPLGAFSRDCIALINILITSLSSKQNPRRFDFIGSFLLAWHCSSQASALEGRQRHGPTL